MKFRFEAIDERGTVLRRVLRAESEEAARDALLAEGVFPKRMESVPEEEKVSWSPKAAARELQQRVHGHREATDSEPDIRERLPATLRRGSEAHRGALIIRSDNSVLFESTGLSILMHRDKVETVRLAGFPLRVLRVSMLDGELLEFAAGLIFAPSFHKRVRALLQRKE